MTAGEYERMQGKMEEVDGDRGTVKGEKGSVSTEEKIAGKKGGTTSWGGNQHHPNPTRGGYC